MEHETEIPEIREPRLVSRRTLVATAAWAVPAVTILGATPAYAASVGRDNILSRPELLLVYADWSTPEEVLGVDGRTAQTVYASGTGAPLKVSGFEIPIRWQYFTEVLYVTLNVKWRVDTMANAPILHVKANYGGAETTDIDSGQALDVLHTFEVQLDSDPTIWITDRDTVLTEMTVEITPEITTSEENVSTTFSVDAIYLIIGYNWHL